MLSLRLPGLLLVLSASLALSACGGGSTEDRLDPLISEPPSEDAGTGTPAGSDDDGVTQDEDADTDDGVDVGTGDDIEPAPVNNAPVISGTPGTEVMENAEYRFVPTAADPDGDEVSFAIENPPGWVQFDAETGTLSGTPSYADVGTTSGIVISVTDGALMTALEAFDLTVVDDGIGNGTAELSWEPPTTRTDGSALTDLEGYLIHYGRSSGDYSERVEVGSGISTHMVEYLGQGQWYFAMTALDSQGVESGFSEEVGKVIDY